MALRILEAKVCGPHLLRVVFNDGISKRVNVWPLLEDPIFEPLRDPAYFARMTLVGHLARLWPLFIVGAVSVIR